MGDILKQAYEGYKEPTTKELLKRAQEINTEAEKIANWAWLIIGIAAILTTINIMTWILK